MSKSKFGQRFGALIAKIAVDGTRLQHIKKAMRRERRMGIAKGKRDARASMDGPNGERTQLRAYVERNVEEPRRRIQELEKRLSDVVSERDEACKKLAEKTKALEYSAKVIESLQWQHDNVVRAIGHSAGAHKTLGGAIYSIRANESRLQREVAKLERELAKAGTSPSIVEANDSIEVGDRFQWKDSPAGAFRIESIVREVVYVYETTSATGHKTGSRSMNAAQAHIRSGKWVRLERVDATMKKSVSENAKSVNPSAILPSSLKIGQRVEFTWCGSRVIHSIGGVSKIGAHAIMDDGSVKAIMLDRDAYNFAIRILKDADGAEFVRVPCFWDTPQKHGAACDRIATTDGDNGCIRTCPRRIAWEAAGCPK